MATPTWNQIAAPNFSAGNDLIAQAMNQLTKATTGFKSIADQYRDTIQKRNLGLIQEYVNSAKTPEELQSEAFKTGLANLTGGMKGEYDPVAVNQYTDSRGDTLTRRAVDNLNLESGRFDLGQKRLRAPTELELLQTQSKNALEQYNFNLKNNPLTLRQNTVATNVAEATQRTQVAQALANLNNTNSTISAREKELKLREQELGIQRLKALADSNKFNFPTSPQGLINDTEQKIRNFEAGIVGDRAKAMGDTSVDENTWLKSQNDWLDGVPKTLVRLMQGKYADKLTGVSDLTPAQRNQVIANAYAKSGLGGELSISSKDFTQLKTTLQNEINAALKGDVDKRDAYAFAQIDNMLNEAYYRDPSINGKKMLDTLNIDPKLKEKYLAHLQEKEKRAQEEAERNLKSPPRKDLPKPSQQGSLIESIAKVQGLPNINLKATDSLNGYLNTQGFANAGIGIYSPENQQAVHTNLARQGKLDAVTASRYAEDIAAKLQRKDLDVLEKEYLTQLLEVFMKNTSNNNGLED